MGFGDLLKSLFFRFQPAGYAFECGERFLVVALLPGVSGFDDEHGSSILIRYGAHLCRLAG